MIGPYWWNMEGIWHSKLIGLKKFWTKLHDQEERWYDERQWFRKFRLPRDFWKKSSLHFNRKLRFLLNGIVSQIKDLVLNFDQTPLLYITVGNSTLEFEGAKPVPVKGNRKEKQIKGTFTTTVAGLFLLMQLTYTGKTTCYHPQSIVFPQVFDVTHSDNHWSNKELVIQYAHEVILPYVNHSNKKRKGSRETLAVLLIFLIELGGGHTGNISKQRKWLLAVRTFFVEMTLMTF